MKTIRHENTLFYYDGPQVFEARDAIGGHYVAVTVESDTEFDRYLVAGVSPERLRQFRSGALDLKSLLIERAEEEWYLAESEFEFRLIGFALVKKGSGKRLAKYRYQVV